MDRQTAFVTLCILLLLFVRCISQSLNCSVFQLQEAISVFSRMGHRVLVFGRQHVKTWEVYKHRSSPHTGWFFTQNLLVILVFVLCQYHDIFICTGSC